MGATVCGALQSDRKSKPVQQMRRIVVPDIGQTGGGSSGVRRRGAAPAAEEIDHALAALSIAYRMCAREADVLLNDAAARCYLAARESSTNPHQHEEEN